MLVSGHLSDTPARFGEDGAWLTRAGPGTFPTADAMAAFLIWTSTTVGCDGGSVHSCTLALVGRPTRWNERHLSAPGDLARLDLSIASSLTRLPATENSSIGIIEPHCGQPEIEAWTRIPFINLTQPSCFHHSLIDRLTFIGLCPIVARVVVTESDQDAKKAKSQKATPKWSAESHSTQMKTVSGRWRDGRSGDYNLVAVSVRQADCGA